VSEVIDIMSATQTNGSRLLFTKYVGYGENRWAVGTHLARMDGDVTARSVVVLLPSFISVRIL